MNDKIKEFEKKLKISLKDTNSLWWDGYYHGFRRATEDLRSELERMDKQIEKEVKKRKS